MLLVFSNLIISYEQHIDNMILGKLKEKIKWSLVSENVLRIINIPCEITWPNT